MGPALRQREGGRTWSLLRAPFMVQMRPAGSSGPVPRWVGTTRHACQGAATLAAFAAVSWPAAGAPPAVASQRWRYCEPDAGGRHRGGLPRGRCPGRARVRLCPRGRRCPLGSRSPPGVPAACAIAGSGQGGAGCTGAGRALATRRSGGLAAGWWLGLPDRPSALRRPVSGAARRERAPAAVGAGEPAGRKLR